MYRRYDLVSLTLLLLSPVQLFATPMDCSTPGFPVLHYIDGIPQWLSGKESAYQCRSQGLDPRVRKSPWKRKWQPIVVFLPV